MIAAYAETVRVVVNGSVTPKVISLVWPFGQRPGGEFQQQVVLPEAQRQGDAEDREGDDDAGTQLIEVLDEAHLILVCDWFYAPHRFLRPASSRRRGGRRGFDHGGLGGAATGAALTGAGSTRSGLARRS